MTAIVLSLLFVGLQLRQSQQVAVEEVISYSNERQNAIRELIVANATWVAGVGQERTVMVSHRAPCQRSQFDCLRTPERASRMHL